MFDHILAPLDGSSLAECVLPHVIGLAETFDSRVTLLRVLEQRKSAGRTQAVDPLGWHYRKVEAEAYLDKLAAQLRRRGIQVESRTLEGDAAESCIEFARDHDVSLFVLSSHGRSGLSGWNISSVVQKILVRAYISTMVVRAYESVTDNFAPIDYRRIMVPLDGSQRAESTLPLAQTLARQQNAKLLLAHVVKVPEMPRRAPPDPEDVELAERLTERNRQEAARYLEQLASRMSSDVETTLLVGDDVPVALHGLARDRDADLFLVTAHGYSARSQWPYGSITTNLITYGARPILVLQDLPSEQIEPTRAEVAAKEYKGH